MKIRTYSELQQFNTLIDRFNYLRLKGRVGETTFGFDRWVNQRFYRSKEWLRVRDKVLIRDMGCDMGLEDYPINGKVMVHHMNPISIKDIVDISAYVLNPEYLICVSNQTHNAIHYGDSSLLPFPLIERRPNDTSPWL